MKNPFKPKHIGVHMLRWHLIPRNLFRFNIYLHKIYANDDERAVHDHPWNSFSIKLFGGTLIEIYKDSHTDISGGNWSLIGSRTPPRLCYRSADFAHRLEIPGKPVWTLFFTGRYRKSWYFHCPDRGMVHYSHMTTLEGTAIANCGDLPAGDVKSRR